MPERIFRWNSGARRYVSAAGRFVSKNQVLGALDRALDNTSLRINSLTQDLQSGKLSLRKWQQEMRREVKNVHLYTGAMSKGGWAQLSPSDYGRIGQRVKEQYKFLDKFAADLASGRTPLDGRAISRSRLYAQSGRQTLHLMNRAEEKRIGSTEERCSLSSSKEACSECVSEAARGWVKIGSLIPIGSRICNQNCRCRVEYR